MNVGEIKILIDRWLNLNNAEKTVEDLNYTEGADRYFKDNILSLGDYKSADAILRNIEKKDRKYIKPERRLVEELPEKARKALGETDWTMLADAPLTTEGKKLYREYRQYLRDIMGLWERKQISEPKVMTFEEWRANPPKYKVEKRYKL